MPTSPLQGISKEQVRLLNREMVASCSNNRREREGGEVRGTYTHTAQHTGSLASSRYNRGMLGTAENASDSLH